MPKSTDTPERKLVIRRQTHRGQFFTERLDEQTGLDMMLIPVGRFMMGAPESELKSREDERPQHLVTVPSFFMGKYPVTQAQWRVVAGYPTLEQELEPGPSDFKGDNRPVENVTWDDATEFCRRLSQHTGRSYRLPSEAEWEYACRAGTTTPFHFGETIDASLANYDAQGDKTLSGTYDRGVFGECRGQTTDVGLLSANAFGLYDMHGNVWEWCEDDWHGGYEDAPIDGSAWVKSDRESSNRLLRGGSWPNIPEYCRSAFRLNSARYGRNNSIGFRVSCVPPRTDS